MTKTRTSLCVGILLFGAIAATPMEAVTITSMNLGTLSGSLTSTGTLANQGIVIEATFTLNTASNLTAYTDSYGGGNNANGTTATAGGFMPSLVLFNSAGQFVANEVFPSPIGNKDPNTGLDGDAYLTRSNLAAGTYILALSDYLVQQPPTAGNLSDGFIDYGSGTTFSDVQGNVRTGNYSLNISASPVSTAAPEPTTFWLITPALALAVVFIRKNRNLGQKETR